MCDAGASPEHASMQSARAELLSLHAELRAVWQEYIACLDIARKLRLLKIYFACQREWNHAFAQYRECMLAWKAGYARDHPWPDAARERRPRLP